MAVDTCICRNVKRNTYLRPIAPIFHCSGYITFFWGGGGAFDYNTVLYTNFCMFNSALYQMRIGLKSIQCKDMACVKEILVPLE